MKEALIGNRVAPLIDISLKIKEFIHQKAALQQSPFKEEQSFVHTKVNKAKRSLTDWRQLYNKVQNKIIPSHTVYPATADGDKIRCSVSGQCNRRKIHSSTNSHLGERSFVTRQTKRSKWSEVKRQSMIEFAIAQNVCHSGAIGDQGSVTSKGKKFYNSRAVGAKFKDYTRVGEFLSNVESSPASMRDIDPTMEYLNKVSGDFKQKIRECNRVKIKESDKLKNERFLDSGWLLNLRKKGLYSSNGLRYYQRG